MNLHLRMALYCLVLPLMILAVGCERETEPEDNDADYRYGTVTYVDLEGGFFGIIGDDGERYNPVNLDNEFKEEGMRIRFEFEEVTDRADIRMWGTMVELRNVQREPSPDPDV